MKHGIFTAICLAASLTAFAKTDAQTAPQGALQISQLSPTNQLVRVDPTARYLLLPVEESVPDAKVEVLLDGNIVKTFYVRLASNRVDFKVPLDLEPFRGKGRILLNIITPDDRTYSRDAGDGILWQELALTDEFDDSNREKFRPLYHHTPRYGWMNDPNGMFYKDGLWHLYYQYNPYGSKWQNMTWGHSTSADLVNWEHHAPAIEPSGLGTVFSGSSVVDKEGTAGFGKDAVISLYTSAGVSQTQSLAHSSDGGMTFTNYPGNPVITTWGEARDPNMFWHEPTGRWILLIAHALEHEMLIYSSPDLKEWTLESAFGKGYGSQAGVWECPDMFPLPVRGSDKQKWVLICNINPGGPFGGSATQYFVGDFDGHRFIPETEPQVTKWMDYGKDHYAAVSFSNAPEGRHTTMAWMSNWEYANEVPTMQYRSANSLPRDHDLFVAPDGDTYMGVYPVKEVEKLRGKATRHKGGSIRTSASQYALPADSQGAMEIDLDIDPVHARHILLTLSNAAGEKVDMDYDVAAGTLTMDRSKSGLVDFSSHFPTQTTAPTHREPGTDIGLKIFLDRSSIEIFDADGRYAMTNLIFPEHPYTMLTLRTTDGTARLKDLRSYPLISKQ